MTLAVEHGSTFAERNGVSATAEEIVAELRTCPPAPGCARVAVAGERERREQAAPRGVCIAKPTWQQIRELGGRLQVAVCEARPAS